MGFTLVQGAAREAVGLIVRSPFRWIAAVLTFLVLSEGVMFIPYVGFLLKLLIGSLLAAGMIKLLEQAAGGEPPRVSRVFSGFGLPMGAKSTLFAGALIPFAAGIAYLYFRSGHSGIAYFFGNVLRDERPTPKDFQAFKTVMYTVATPLVFVAAAVVLNRLSGWTAFETAIKAAVRHWPAPLTVLAMNLAFERIVVAALQSLPQGSAGPATGILVIVYLAWSFAFTYSLAVRALSPDREAVLEAA